MEPLTEDIVDALPDTNRVDRECRVRLRIVRPFLAIGHSKTVTLSRIATIIITFLHLLIRRH